MKSNGFLREEQVNLGKKWETRKKAYLQHPEGIKPY